MSLLKKIRGMIGLGNARSADASVYSDVEIAAQMDIDIDTLARTLYGEARGEGAVGMQAVACVVLNRVALSAVHGRFGNGTIASACTAKWQFSCWNANDPNLPKLKSVTEADPSFSLAMEIAIDAVNGNLEDITNGATYYYVKGSKEPAWAVGQVPCAKIGAHHFYRDIA